MPDPVPIWPPDTQVLALLGSTDPKTQLDYIESDTGPDSTPPLSVRETRREQRLNDNLAPLMFGRVFDEGSLKIGVVGGDYILGGSVKTFAGVTAQAITDNATNYVYIDQLNALVVNTTGFPSDLTTFVPLAEVVVASGAVTISDKRSRALFTISNAVGTFANAALDNLASVAISESLVSDTDNLDDLGSSLIAWKNAFLAGSLIYGGASRAFATTLAAAVPAAARVVTIPDFGADDQLVGLLANQTLEGKTLKGAAVESTLGLVFKQTTADLTLKASDPAAARLYTLPDAGADAQVVLTAGTQTLAGKTLTAPTIADLTNANHDHSGAAAGGVLTSTSHGTGKYCPVVVAIPVGEATLTTGVKNVRIVMPAAYTLKHASGSVVTPPTGQAIICDVRVNSASIYANQTEMINIADATNEDDSATKDFAGSAGDVIDINVLQVGSTAAGGQLTVTLYLLMALAS